MQAVHRYQCLAALIDGQHPRNLLQPASQRLYVVSRIKALAEGSVLKAFTWNGGGSFAGRSWSTDLPNDSTLLLFLFAAYLEVGFLSLPPKGWR